MPKEIPYILSVPLLIRVDREGGVPYASLDKIRGYLAEAAVIEWDREGCGDIDEEHAVTSMEVDWEQLRHGVIGESHWQCPDCGNIVTVEDRELETIGTPMCGDCDLEMVEYADNRIKCVSVEYDPNYTGGDYNKTGEFAYIPFALVDELKNPEPGVQRDDDDALKIAFERVTGVNPVHIIHYTFDEPVDQDGNEWVE